MIPLLSVKNLTISFSLFGKITKVLQSVSFSLSKGECLGIVGESGSGKSTLAKAIVGLNPSSIVEGGEILYRGTDLLPLDEPSLRGYRGKEIAMVFQDSLSSLNPTMPIGKQVLESYQKHHPKATKGQAYKKVIELLRWIEIQNPEERYYHYPHQFSGGMRQRIVIAIALAAEPKILIADEPTSSLDATIQMQIISLFKKIQNDLGMSIIFITHDLSLASEFTSKLLVMHQGLIVEEGPTQKVLTNPTHLYTQKLLHSRPIRTEKRPIFSQPILQVSHLSFDYTIGKSKIQALQNLSFEIQEGETLGLVGESGSGKTTLALILMHLLKPSKGTILYRGSPLTRESTKEIQMVFQDPYSALNPRMTVQEIVREPLVIYKIGTKAIQKERIDELLYLVGLDSTFAERYPHELSGGQRQRVVIARALAPKPKFLICDEPLASLDLSIAAQIIELLEELQRELNLTYLFISHDLATVKYLSDHVAVLYSGELVEFGESRSLYETPSHPYTQSILRLSHLRS